MVSRVARYAYVMTALLAISGVASAEPRRTTVATTLRKKPGEKEPAVAEVPAGTQVQVLGEQDRWLRVRVGAQEGFLTRTTVTAPEDPPAATGEEASTSQEERVWSARRRRAQAASGELFAKVTSAEATLRAEAAPTATPLATLTRGSQLAILDATSTSGWVRVRDERGREGWLVVAELGNGSASVAASTPAVQTAEQHDSKGFTRRSAPMVLRAELGMGYRSLGMDLSSNASGGLSNYLVDADAAALTATADAAWSMGERWQAAADVRLQLSASSPGIEYPGPTSTSGEIPFRTFAADAGVRVGVRARKLLALAARIGAHYDAFLPTDVDNVGTLPRERLLGFTGGARLDLAPPASRFSATLRLDALVWGTRAQTTGLEDGADSTAHAFWGGLTLRYMLSTRLAAFVGYDFERATTRWNGMSVRQRGVTATRREDTAQLTQLGVTAEL